jgi:hypothetical protein
MKKSSFWKLGITAAMLFGLSACNDTVSSSDDEEKDSKKTTELSSSSNDDDHVKSSGKEIKSSASKVIGCDSMTVSLAAPSDLNIVKNSDSTWILLWNYTSNELRPEEVFIIQSLNMSDSIPKWKTIDSTTTGVTMYNLKGSKKAGKYYRIAAKDYCSTSGFTSMVQASSTGAGSTSVDASLAVPSNLALEALGNDQWRLSWSYEENANRPENGFKVQYLNISSDSPKWKDAGTTNKGVRVFKIEGSDKRGYMYHVAAIDANGKSEYSSEITVPKEGLGSTGTENEVTISAPTDLKLDSIGPNKWRLSWKHNNKTERPENGFSLQRLDMNNLPTWANLGESKRGVHYYIIDNNDSSFNDNFIRVAAKDSLDNNKPAAYSEEILIPSFLDYSTGSAKKIIAAPTGLKLDTLGFGSFQLSWEYDDYADNGFILQTLDPQNTQNGWENRTQPEYTIVKGVHLVVIDGTGDAGGKLFRVAALIGSAKEDTSLFSSAISIPQIFSDGTVNNGVMTTLAAPSNLKAERIAPSVWRLAWDYSKKSKEAKVGFLIQHLNNPNSEQWTELATTEEDVHYYNLEGLEYLDQYFRVAAFTDDDTTEFSSDIQVLRSTPYAADYPFTAPIVKARIFYDGVDGLDQTPYEFMTIATDSLPNHAIVNSKYTAELKYQFRWNNEGSAKWTSVDIIETKNFSTTASRDFETTDELCHSYASVRIVWKDIYDNQDSTDWTIPVGPLYNQYEYKSYTGSARPCDVE